MSGIADISPLTGLKPVTRFFPEVGEDCINADGIITIMQQANTPEAKRINRAFRRRHAMLRQSPGDRSPEKLRTDALLAALEDCGVHINFRPAGSAA